MEQRLRGSESGRELEFSNSDTVQRMYQYKSYGTSDNDRGGVAAFAQSCVTVKLMIYVSLPMCMVFLTPPKKANLPLPTVSYNRLRRRSIGAVGVDFGDVLWGRVAERPHLRHRHPYQSPTTKRLISRRSPLVSMTVRWMQLPYILGCISLLLILLPAK